VITTSARATVSFWDASYSRPLALLLGAEGTGLPGEVLAQGDLQVRIPMVGTAESLNLAVAAGLLIYEAQRKGGLDPA
jgi:TrmH family RNA methyltransferase